MLSALLIDVLLRSGVDLGPISIPGIDIKLPAPYAIVVLVFVAGASGWAGFAYLRQALSLMYHLEFENRIDPDKIKAALAGSSLASANILLFKLLCLISFLASGVIVLSVFFIIPLAKVLMKIGIEPSLFAYMGVSTVLELPFLLVILSPRMRYLQPSNWDEGSWWLSKFVFKRLGEQMSTSAHHRGFEALPSEVSHEDAVTLVDELVGYMGQATSTCVHMLLRKYGVVIFLRWNKLEMMFLDEFRHFYDRKTDDILCRKFPDIEEGARKVFKNKILCEFMRL